MLTKNELRLLKDSARDLIYSVNRNYFFELGYTNLFDLHDIDAGISTKVYPASYSFSTYSLFDIDLDTDQVEEFADALNIDVCSAGVALISHEIFHVLLDHFNPKYDNLNYKVFNIAADLEVNSYIDIDSPAIRAHQFGLPDFLRAKDYYDMILKNMQDNETQRTSVSTGSSAHDDSDERNEPSSQSNEKSDETQDNNQESSKNSEEQKKSEQSKVDKAEVNDQIEQATQDNIFNDNIEKISKKDAQAIHDIVSKLNIGTESIIRTGKTVSRAVTRHLGKSNIEGLDELISKLIRRESTMAITPHTRRNTYMKFNNRRKNGSIILPGKKLENKGVRKKFDTSLTVFIDMSASTFYINKQLNAVSYKFHEAGATVVYYDSKIIEIVRPDKRHVVMDSRGGTNIVKTLNHYLSDPNNKLERAYIITDGYDDFRFVDEVVPKYTIYHINKYRIQELFSDKNPCTKGYGY